MPLPDLRVSWDNTTYLPENLKQTHLKNLDEAEHSGTKILAGRVHIDVMDTLVRKIKDSDKYELIKPVYDLMLDLLGTGKDVRLLSSLPTDTVKSLLIDAGADPQVISDLKVMDRGELVKETKFGQDGKYEILIDNKEEDKRFPMHLTQEDPAVIENQANSGPA